MAAYPEIQAKVQEEIDTVVGKDNMANQIITQTGSLPLIACQPRWIDLGEGTRLLITQIILR